MVGWKTTFLSRLVPLLQREHVSFEVCIVLVVVWYRPFNVVSPPFTGATKKHRKLPSFSDIIQISMESRGFLEFDLCLVGCKSRCSRHLSFSHRDGREPQTRGAVGDVYWSHWRPGKIGGNWWLVERCGFFSFKHSPSLSFLEILYTVYCNVTAWMHCFFLIGRGL